LALQWQRNAPAAGNRQPNKAESMGLSCQSGIVPQNCAAKAARCRTEGFSACDSSRDSGEALPAEIFEDELQYARVSQTASTQGKKLLRVPPVFAVYQASTIYALSGATQATLMDRQRACLSEVLRCFARDLMRGVSVEVIHGDGSTTPSTIKLDKSAASVSIFDDRQVPVDGLPESVHMKSIRQVCSALETRNVELPNRLFVDDCCACLVLTTRPAVTMRFDAPGTQEYFARCFRDIHMAALEAVPVQKPVNQLARPGRAHVPPVFSAPPALTGKVGKDPGAPRQSETSATAPVQE